MIQRKRDAVQSVPFDSKHELFEEDLVHDRFQVFLSAAARQFRSTELFCVCGKFCQCCLIVSDLLSEFILPGRISLFDKGVASTVCDHIGSLDETHCECIHAEDKCIEHVFHSVGRSSVLGVEVEASGQSAVLQHFIHAECRIIDIEREFISIPSQQCIALVGIDGSEHAVDRADAQIMI